MSTSLRVLVLILTLLLCTLTVFAQHIIRDINLQRTPVGSFPGGLATIDNVTYFFANNDPEIGNELWRTDGTQAGTWLVRDILPGGELPLQEQPRRRSARH